MASIKRHTTAQCECGAIPCIMRETQYRTSAVSQAYSARQREGKRAHGAGRKGGSYRQKGDKIAPLNPESACLASTFQHFRFRTIRHRERKSP